MKVRFADVDRAGIVYYPRFFHFFHVAFEEFFGNRLGVPYTEVLGTDRIGFPVVRVETSFYKPITFGDTIEIDIGINRIGTKSATLHYALRKAGENEVRAEAKITIVCINLDTFRGQPLTDKYRKLFEEYAASTQGC